MTALIARTLYRLAGGTTTVPVTLGLRNIYILPTGYGTVFLMALVAMLIGSINYNNNLGFLLTFLLGSMGLVALMHTYSMLYGLRLTAASATPAFAGQSMEVDITVADVVRPCTALRWFFNPHDQIEVDVMPGGIGHIRVRVPTDRRGHFYPGCLRISCEYPLGMFRAWVRINTDAQCLVYPKPIAAPAPKASMPPDGGQGPVSDSVGVDDFQGLSAYQPGDSLRHIHWQAYSRGRGLHTKTFTGQTGAGLMLDIGKLNGNDTEKKLSILCFHVLHAYHQRNRYGLKLGGETVPVGSGRVHRDRCLRALALFGKH